MAIYVSAYAMCSSVEAGRFESIREVVGSFDGNRREPNGARARLEAVSLRCQKGAPMFSAVECLSCPRFVNCVPTRTGLSVRCLWCDDDRVDDVMTQESALVWVSPSTPVPVADRIAEDHGVRHLLVVEHERLVGIVCRCDLLEPAAPTETVSYRVNRCPWVVRSGTTLAEAAAIMARQRVGCLPVLLGRRIVGVVTRGDLRRVGIDESLLGAGVCASCGSVRAVRPHPTLDSVEFCLDCLEQSQAPIAYQELGVGG